tara:strand:- start:434 stop:907 length:474 start_codon:yes stop_codon:yes gene_type:complete
MSLEFYIVSFLIVSIITIAIFNPGFLRKLIAVEVAKDILNDFCDGEGYMSKERYEEYISQMLIVMKEDGMIKRDIDTDALFEKYDKDDNGKLDLKEIELLADEFFMQMQFGLKTNQEINNMWLNEREIEKIEKLYKEGYLTAAGYNRLKNNLIRKNM